MFEKWFREVGIYSGIKFDAGKFRMDLRQSLKRHEQDGFQESDERQVCNIEDFLERYFAIQSGISNIKFESHRQESNDNLESVMQYLYGRKATNEKFYRNFLGNSIDADTISSRFIIDELSSDQRIRELLIARDIKMQVVLGVCELYTVKIRNSFADVLRTRCSRRIDLMGFLFLDLDKWPASYEISDPKENKQNLMTFRVYEEQMQVEDEIRIVAIPKGFQELIKEYCPESVVMEIWRSHKDPMGDGFFWKWLSQHEYVSRFRKLSPEDLVELSVKLKALKPEDKTVQFKVKATELIEGMDRDVAEELLRAQHDLDEFIEKFRVAVYDEWESIADVHFSEVKTLEKVSKRCRITNLVSLNLIAS